MATITITITEPAVWFFAGLLSLHAALTAYSIYLRVKTMRVSK